MQIVIWTLVGFLIGIAATYVLLRKGQGTVANHGRIEFRPEHDGDSLSQLSDLERSIAVKVATRKSVVLDAAAVFEAQATLGQRVADRVASFGGSWPFIGLFGAVLVIWMLINVSETKPFDPYPFILLNLVLSCLAALQAPVIMMSQNRQAARDRIDARNDYRVNISAEMQIVALHVKVDQLMADRRLELERRRAEGQ